MAEEIFLSHWHEDAAVALALQHALEDELGVHVFCSSSPADRFPDLHAPAGIDPIGPVKAHADELRRYLGDHLDRATVCLLLITEQSVARNSGAVAWEVQVARDLARDRGGRLIPCLLGVGYEALGARSASEPSTWQKLEFGPPEPGAPEREFQAIQVAGRNDVDRMVSEIVRALRRAT